VRRREFITLLGGGVDPVQLGLVASLGLEVT
jgi:hypothetical protein